jgi:hypothetical protein
LYRVTSTTTQYRAISVASAYSALAVTRLWRQVLIRRGQKYHLNSSVVTSKAAICGHFKTGHMDWPET